MSGSSVVMVLSPGADAGAFCSSVPEFRDYTLTDRLRRQAVQFSLAPLRGHANFQACVVHIGNMTEDFRNLYALLRDNLASGTVTQ